MLVKAVPAGDAWLHEPKYDGYRIGCLVEPSGVRLVSRRGNDWTASFPEIAAAARGLGACALDGEIAALDAHGRTSFQRLQNAFGAGARPRLVYFVFDLLSLAGEDLRRLPLEDRKALLEGLLAPRPTGAILYTPHAIGDGAAVFAAACRAGLEGIVSKRRDARYVPGRGPSWVKTKCVLRQELVICGVTDRAGSNGQEVGALVLGWHDGGALVYAGKVGTGLTQQASRDLRRRLRALEQPRCPFPRPPTGVVGRDVHWARPELVCEVSFTELTAGGHLRHPSFAGLRLDKRARDVVRERPIDLPAVRAAEAPHCARGNGAAPP